MYVLAGEGRADQERSVDTPGTTERIGCVSADDDMCLADPIAAIGGTALIDEDRRRWLELIDEPAGFDYDRLAHPPVTFRHEKLKVEERIPAARVEAFADALHLFWIAESWGGHLSLVLPVHAKREVSPLPVGSVLRFHAGLEDCQDLLRDLEQATKVL